MSKRAAATAARLLIQQQLDADAPAANESEPEIQPRPRPQIRPNPVEEHQPIRQALQDNAQGPAPVDRDENGDPLWEMESIRDFRRRREDGVVEYLIRWKAERGVRGELTWEAAANIQSKEALYHFFDWRNRKRTIGRMRAEAHRAKRANAAPKGIGNSEEELPDLGSTRRAMRALLGLCRTHLILTLTILSVIIGLLSGFILRGFNLNSETVRLINFPGEIFMQALKLMILPLIFSSLISALAQMDARESGQMGYMTLLYYTTTTVLAAITGIILVLAIHPGNPAITSDLQYSPVGHGPLSPLDAFLDVVRNMFPGNVIKATFQHVRTKVQPEPGTINHQNGSSGSSADGGAEQEEEVKKETENVRGMNILGIIVFCTAFGIVISQLGEKARIAVDFFVVLEAAIMKLVETLMWFAPIGIMSLIAGNLLDLEDLSDTATVLFLYVITVLSGLAIHTICTMPLLYFFLTRKNPMKVIRSMVPALVTTFATSSGGAALPVSMHCMENNLKVDRRITRFVLPLGSNINIDGNALYEAVTVIFIAQLNNVTLSIAEVITISFIATIASLGLNSAPAGLVSISVILRTVGLPTKDVSLIITVDWLLDRIRTSINVLGDAFAASTLSHYLEKKLIQSNKFYEFDSEIRADPVTAKISYGNEHLESRNDPNKVRPMGDDLTEKPPQDIEIAGGGCCLSFIPNREKCKVGPCEHEFGRDLQQQLGKRDEW
ncbi:sodium:dicarboxylate symporter family domain-containing protein [Ditylenchus destructor]|uniref:Amino acid transporter n=1 Tax=Ditylenchus destructor TaxID=166010 RepID=A0AAD4MTR0_9BILA|nr:sodium:dicarboxylate symporter family domain-containing protein [Ditylenchus destructor]